MKRSSAANTKPPRPPSASNGADHRDSTVNGTGREVVVKVKAVRRRPEVRGVAAGAHPHIRRAQLRTAQPASRRPKLEPRMLTAPGDRANPELRLSDAPLSPIVCGQIAPCRDRDHHYRDHPDQPHPIGAPPALLTANAKPPVRHPPSQPSPHARAGFGTALYDLPSNERRACNPAYMLSFVWHLASVASVPCAFV